MAIGKLLRKGMIYETRNNATIFYFDEVVKYYQSGNILPKEI